MPSSIVETKFERLQCKQGERSRWQAIPCLCTAKKQRDMRASINCVKAETHVEWYAHAHDAHMGIAKPTLPCSSLADACRSRRTMLGIKYFDSKVTPCKEAASRRHSHITTSLSIFPGVSCQRGKFALGFSKTTNKFVGLAENRMRMYQLGNF